MLHPSPVTQRVHASSQLALSLMKHTRRMSKPNTLYSTRRPVPRPRKAPRTGTYGRAL